MTTKIVTNLLYAHYYGHSTHSQRLFQKGLKAVPCGQHQSWIRNRDLSHGSLTVFRFDGDEAALEIIRDVAFDDAARELVRAQTGNGITLDTEEAAIAGRAQERPVEFNGTH